jgi:hypothetical protein
MTASPAEPLAKAVRALAAGAAAPPADGAAKPAPRRPQATPQAVRPASPAAPPPPAVEAEPAAGPAINGRVDAIDNGRLYGWVWSPEQPDARLCVRVLMGDQEIGTAVADRMRVDLRRNGIGDGGHAFELALPADVAAAGDRLTVVAFDPETGRQLTLRAPSPDERAAEAAVAVPLARVLDRLDRLILAQRQLTLGQKGAADDLAETMRRLDKLTAADTGLGEAVETVRAGQIDLSVRLEQMEVFLVRFDASLSGFDSRLKSLAERSRNELRPQLLALAALLGVGIGLAIGLVVSG